MLVARGRRRANRGAPGRVVGRGEGRHNNGLAHGPMFGTVVACGSTLVGCGLLSERPKTFGRTLGNVKNVVGLGKGLPSGSPSWRWVWGGGWSVDWRRVAACLGRKPCNPDGDPPASGTGHPRRILADRLARNRALRGQNISQARHEAPAVAQG